PSAAIRHYGRRAELFMVLTLAFASPQVPGQHADLVLHDLHRVEDQVLAESTAHDLHACWQALDESDGYDAGRQAQAVHPVAVDGGVEQILRLREALRVVVPGERGPHEERRE